MDRLLRNHRHLYAGLLAASIVAIVAGCTSTAEIEPAPSPTSVPTPTSIETPAGFDLPSDQQIIGALDTAPGSVTLPDFARSVPLNEGASTSFSNSRPATAAGTTAMLRISCTSDEGKSVVVTVEADGVDAVNYEAPCSPTLATGFAITTTQMGPFALASTYTARLTSDVRAAVGFGLLFS